MGIKQVEKLYEKMIGVDDAAKESGNIDEGVRAEIFQKIMGDVDRLLKKLKRCKQGSREFIDLDCEIRNLLLKEIQVIIDDYVIAQKKGTLGRWENMYGDINKYKNNFQIYRETHISNSSENILSNYGFFDQEDLM